MAMAMASEATLLDAVRLKRDANAERRDECDGGGRQGASGRNSAFIWTGSGEAGGSHIFGGVLLAQAAAAAMASGEAPGHKHLHAMHARFLAAGDARGPEVKYSVTKLRSGGSFSAYRVDAFQRSRLLFTANVSLTGSGGTDTGTLDSIAHVAQMPSLPTKMSREHVDEMPTVLESLLALVQGRPKTRRQLSARVIKTELWRERINGFPGLEIKFVDPLVGWAWKTGNAYGQRSGSRSGRSPAQRGSLRKTRQHFWVRVRSDEVREALRSDHRISVAMLAFITDMYLIETALHSVGLLLGNEYIDPLSLDHAVFFHGHEGGEDGERWRLDDWLLMELEVISVRNGRTLCSGKAFSEKGDHICTCIQEGLLRVRARL